ncbi:hypothetical protein FALBO_6559 [Fusarium albosuccineum]|uniref:Uncharacterized protein n=1 Tax=Fusarium albosuccineum TaxID=1237068 RepID=A0A8H4LEN0_9HYPO|nr:hypothetical protein FALBO_6559 [Fusarium albosuccineum]
MGLLRGIFNALRPRQRATFTLHDVEHPNLSTEHPIPVDGEFLDHFNPFQDLPDDPVLENTLCEVLYINRTLAHFLLPTSLPGDDYALCSKLLRSLETRRDLSPSLLLETDARINMRQLAWRRSESMPIPHEPFNLQSRIEALDSHYRNVHILPPILGLRSTQPYRPLIPGGTKLDLTHEQAAEAEAGYREWRIDRDRRASYLKQHPPLPCEFIVVDREDVSPDDRVWDMLPRFRGKTLYPFYHPLILHKVPVSWVNPGAPSSLNDTPAEKRRWEEQMRQRMNRRYEQYKYQKESAEQ